MLHILTDEQISPEVAEAARKRCPGIQIMTLFEWMEGHFVGAPDGEILSEAFRQKLTLLSFDLRTLPRLLRAWGEQGTPHAGLIFIDEKSIQQSDVGGLARALCELWKTHGDADWTDRCFFLQRVKKR